MDGSRTSGWAYGEVLRLHAIARPSRSESAGRFQAVVLAGGSGTRLTALIRTLFGTTVPKQFCSFDGGGTLLQQTLQRLRHVRPRLRPTVLVPREHTTRAAAQLRLHDDVSILDQPDNCGTGIGLLRALVDVLVRRPDAVVHVTPADHGIGNVAEFASTMSACLELAGRHVGHLFMVGVEPSCPRQDFGWMVPGESQHGFSSVNRFVEKPAPADAVALFDTGAVWSTMLLTATGKALLDLFERSVPHVVRMFLHYASLPKREQPRYLNAMYRGLSSLDLSRDILSGAKNLMMRTLPTDVEWTDLGTEARVHAWMRQGKHSSTSDAQPLRQVQGERRARTGTGVAVDSVGRTSAG